MDSPGAQGPQGKDKENNSDADQPETHGGSNVIVEIFMKLQLLGVIKLQLTFGPTVG